MLTYFYGWVEGKDYSSRITSKGSVLKNKTHVFFRGEDGTETIIFE